MKNPQRGGKVGAFSHSLGWGGKRKMARSEFG